MRRAASTTTRAAARGRARRGPRADREPRVDPAAARQRPVRAARAARRSASRAAARCWWTSGSAARRARWPPSSRPRTRPVTTPSGGAARMRRALPTFAYSAVGFADGALLDQRLPRRPRSAPGPVALHARRACARGIEARRAELPRNRVARQLEKCALCYGCRAAQNFFLGRHEAPLPSSSACNAQCIGCISLQPDGAFRASHDRLAKPPSRRGARRRRALAPLARAATAW